jgi:transcriptional regulator with XRE-family HTH domain
MEGPSTLAEYLRTAREQAGISQRQLASRVGIHHSYLARLESGETANPAADLLQKIADVLEINSADLFAFIGVKPPEGLPELAPYLRAKYHLDEVAARALAELVGRLAQDQESKTKDQ